MKRLLLSVPVLLALVLALALGPAGVALAGHDILHDVPVNGPTSPEGKFEGYLTVNRLDLNPSGTVEPGALLIDGRLVGYAYAYGKVYKIDQFFVDAAMQLVPSSGVSEQCSSITLDVGPIALEEGDLTLDPNPVLLSSAAADDDEVLQLLCRAEKQIAAGAEPQVIQATLEEVNARLAREFDAGDVSVEPAVEVNPLNSWRGSPNR